MPLSERIHQLNGEISATVERAITELRQEIAQRLRASNEEIQRRLEELAPALPASYLSHEDFAEDFAHGERTAGSAARRGAQRDLRDSVAAIDRARSQAEILTALLRESVRYASRAAVLLTRGGEVRGWGSEGFGEADAAIRGLALTPQNGAWSRLLEGQSAVRLTAGDCADLCSRVESPLPQGGVLVPIVLRDRLAAALYADRQGDSELAAEALQVLAYVASQAIETLPFRERAATPTLSLPDEPAAESAAASEPAAEAVTATATAEPEASEVEVEAEPEPAYAAPAPWTAEDEQSAVAAEPEAAPAAPADNWQASPSYTEELPMASVAAAAAAAPAVDVEEAPRYPRSVEPEPAAPARFPDASPEATVLLQRSALQQAAEAAAAPAPAPQPLRPVPVPAPAPAPAVTEEPAQSPSGTPEVRPPSGVDGPGWAFATTRVPVSPSDETMHEEARRLARLLVSEIKLYNEEQVEEGRRNRDIYERLKEDIDRSRQMYDERVDPRILRSTDYFYQELVRILAAGDSRALGI
ncbi:MAG TPA: hypothetical protein VHC97_01385 [Thermoanaerobaculia bacterium]|jgi:hypothetical protein|nr:hypothetical protein [Thermoanaerobaculia bacterium]